MCNWQERGIQRGIIMIYITTHHRVENFGAVLQAYGLQQFLKSMGYENELVLLKKENKEKNMI